MTYIILACLLFVALASAKSAFTELEYRNAFTNWMVQQGKQYGNHEFNQRYNIFKANMDFVNEWNSKGSQTVLGMNVFADLTNKEYQMLYLKNKFNTYDLSQKAKTFKSSGKQAVEVDWRLKDAVTPIKNQGECGGCWSFSVSGAVEGVHAIGDGNLVVLSEQQLIDCSDSFGNQGCDGGLMTLGFEYIISAGGLDTEASYPYTGVQGKCKFNPANIGASISGYVNVTSGSEDALASAVQLNPVSVAIDASLDSFQLYTSGIYYDASCSSTELDHAVLAVGYGSGVPPAESSESSSDSWTGASYSQGSNSGSNSGSWSSGSWTGSQGSWTGSQGSWTGSQGSWTGSQSWGEAKQAASESSSSSSDNYWIVKNSWGPEWGVNGYIYMSKDRNNNCGIATMASYPINA
ncbi:cysteine proteinase [Tieghemostelium lacteum]|uniref:Cysteine proteinase n=1 Tax=Tieghemostelium lacteum TaxID=361077 RepID=A0A152A566_TIELA|nr:cysteine proteinase [Tieghemostelium lacteum]|eukprot:KYR01383.1 cysteine proteinase [Tieghemostelium lacteum]